MDALVNLTKGDLMVIDMVDEYLEKALSLGSPEPLFNYGRVIARTVQANGLAMFKLCYLLENHWEEFRKNGTTGDNEVWTAIAQEVGLSAFTAKSYAGVWKRVFMNEGIPKEIKEELIHLPVQALLLLPAAAEEGNLDWKEVVNATTVNEVRNAVRKARGEATSSNTRLLIFMDEHGTLTAKRGDNGEMKNIGYLNLIEASRDEVIDAAIERIRKQAGVILL